MPTADRYARYRADQTTIWVSKKAANSLAKERSSPTEGTTAILDRLLNELRRLRRVAGEPATSAPAATKSAPAKAAKRTTVAKTAKRAGAAKTAKRAGAKSAKSAKSAKRGRKSGRAA
jgi:hypothetical protein